MKVLKYILGIVFFIAAFFGEATFRIPVKSGKGAKNVEYQPVPVSHRISNHTSADENTQLIDELVTSFMEEYEVVGTSVAVARKGQLVFAKGYGYADQEKGIEMEPRHLLRIASVSKLITAVAVMQLVEDNEINLDDQVFGYNGLLNDELYLNASDPRIYDITIRHLLQHTGGWSKYKGDPVFMLNYIRRKYDYSASLNDFELVTNFVMNRNLNFSPGSHYSYSNYGYTVLGKVIEKVTGLRYEDYVQFYILDPLEIYDMEIGGSFYEDRKPGEVKYYEAVQTHFVKPYNGHKAKVPMAYGGNNLNLIAAAGGWIASPTELMKFILAVDGEQYPLDIIGHDTYQKMTEPSGEAGQLIGWKGTDGRGTLWRTGTLTGTSALVVKQVNGLTWIILLNTTTRKGPHIHAKLSSLMFTAVNRVEGWSNEDLFDYFDPSLMAQNFND